MRYDKETYWKWSKHYVPPCYRGAAEKKRAEIELQRSEDQPALARYAAVKATLPTVINRTAECRRRAA